MTPTEWFDQFPPLAEGSPWNTEGQWCPRHWAPCPVMGANGIAASLELMRIWLEEMMPAGVSPDEPERLNAAMREMGYLCCTLGDERMYEIWGHCPPEEEGDGVPTTR